MRLLNGRDGNNNNKWHLQTNTNNGVSRFQFNTEIIVTRSSN